MSNVPSWAQSVPSEEAKPSRRKTTFYILHVLFACICITKVVLFVKHVGFEFTNAICGRFSKKLVNASAVKVSSKSAIWTQSMKCL